MIFIGTLIIFLIVAYWIEWRREEKKLEREYEIYFGRKTWNDK